MLGDLYSSPIVWGYLGLKKALIEWVFLLFLIPFIFYFFCIVPCRSHCQVLKLLPRRSSFVGKPVSDTVWFLLSSDFYPWSDGRDGSTVVPALAAALLQPCPAMPPHCCSALGCSFHLPRDSCAELVEAEVILQTGATERLDVLVKVFPTLHSPCPSIK